MQFVIPSFRLHVFIPIIVASSSKGNKREDLRDGNKLPGLPLRISRRGRGWREMEQSIVSFISVSERAAAMVADGAAMVAEGAAMVADGAAMVADGAAMVADGRAMVAEGAAIVADGAAMLAGGAAMLAGGAAMVAFPAVCVLCLFHAFLTSIKYEHINTHYCSTAIAPPTIAPPTISILVSNAFG